MTDGEKERAIGGAEVMTAPTITLERLQKAGACHDQTKIFKQLFGDAVAVTEKTCCAVAGVFDWDWAAITLLTAPARAEYDRARASAWAEYERARVLAWAEYGRARASAWAEYDSARASAWDEYDRARASAWARAFISDNASNENHQS